MFRKRAAPPPVDPIAALDRTIVPARMTPLLDQAIGAYSRWTDVQSTVAAGPLADRLATLGDQVRHGVVELHGASARVGEVERVLAALDPEGATDAYKAAKRRSIDGETPPELAALEARFASVQRMMNQIGDADDQLRVLHAQLLASVAQCAEIALTADPLRLATAGDTLDGVVDQLAALRSALVELR